MESASDIDSAQVINECESNGNVHQESFIAQTWFAPTIMHDIQVDAPLTPAKYNEHT